MRYLKFGIICNKATKYVLVNIIALTTSTYYACEIKHSAHTVICQYCNLRAVEAMIIEYFVSQITQHHGTLKINNLKNNKHDGLVPQDFSKRKASTLEGRLAGPKQCSLFPKRGVFISM